MLPNGISKEKLSPKLLHDIAYGERINKNLIIRNLSKFIYDDTGDINVIDMAANGAIVGMVFGSPLDDGAIKSITVLGLMARNRIDVAGFYIECYQPARNGYIANVSNSDSDQSICRAVYDLTQPNTHKLVTSILSAIFKLGYHVYTFEDIFTYKNI